MKEVIRYKTADGKLFNDYRAAEPHAKQRYETQLDHTARRIFRAAVRDATFATPTVLCEFLDDADNIKALLDLFERRKDARAFESEVERGETDPAS